MPKADAPAVRLPESFLDVDRVCAAFVDGDRTTFVHATGSFSLDVRRPVVGDGAHKLLTDDGRVVFEADERSVRAVVEGLRRKVARSGRGRAAARLLWPSLAFLLAAYAAGLTGHVMGADAFAGRDARPDRRAEAPRATVQDSPSAVAAVAPQAPGAGGAERPALAVSTGVHRPTAGSAEKPSAGGAATPEARKQLLTDLSAVQQQLQRGFRIPEQLLNRLPPDIRTQIEQAQGTAGRDAGAGLVTGRPAAIGELPPPGSWASLGSLALQPPGGGNLKGLEDLGDFGFPATTPR